MKDKLLDLSIKGRISDEEFESRNEQFNYEIEEMKKQIEELEIQEMKNLEVDNSVETLRKLIANELDFNEGVENSLVDSLLDHIEVYKTEEKNVIKLKVFLKVVDEKLDVLLKRKRGMKTSVCIESHI